MARKRLKMSMAEYTTIQEGRSWAVTNDIQSTVQYYDELLADAARRHRLPESVQDQHYVEERPQRGRR